MTFLRTRPRPPRVIILIKGAGEEGAPLLFPWQLMSARAAAPPTNSRPAPAKLPPACPVRPPRAAGCHSRTVLQTGPLPHPRNTDVSVADSRLFLRSRSWVSTALAGLQCAAQHTHTHAHAHTQSRGSTKSLALTLCPVSALRPPLTWVLAGLLTAPRLSPSGTEDIPRPRTAVPL